MVYSSPDQEHEDIFLAQAPGLISNEPSVQVKFAGSGLHKIAGPVPFVNLAKTYNRNAAGILENISTNVTINGRIVRAPTTSGVYPAGTGLGAILAAIEAMRQLFSCQVASFEVLCDGSGISVSGTKVKNFSANKTEDNWTFSADYTAELEYFEPGQTGYPPVQNTTDTWSIEPLEEYTYTNFNVNVSGMTEYSNPNIKPAITSPNTRSSSSSSNPLSIINIPQYKISRRLSAIGFPISQSGSGCFSPTGNYTAYLTARDWVTKKLGESFITNGPSGSISLVKDTSNILSSFDRIFLFNHLRTINFSITEGSYEVNDTWLAMPTGISYIEDYSLESSTDEKYIKTVRVQGNIKGLSYTPIAIMSGSGITPTGISPAKLNLDYSLQQGSGTFSNDVNILDNISEKSNNKNVFSANKYQNALSGWINDVKPYLYRRACLVVNNANDRNNTYLNPAISPSQAPQNPIYCRENFLNTIPVSTTEGHDPRKGTISYTYEYNNRLKFISGVINENISINDTGPVDVINETFILGRRLGPILQAVGKTSAKKEITIEVTVLPPSSLAGFPMNSKECPLYTGGTVYQAITGIIEGLKPYGDRLNSIFGSIGGFNIASRTQDNGQVYINKDDHSWNPAEGRYTRNIGWTYQACNVTRQYLDH